MEKKLIKKELLAAAEKGFLQSAELWAEKLKHGDSLDVLPYRLVELLAAFNTSTSNNMLQQFLPAKENYFRQTVLIYLLENKQAVPGWAFDSIAADARLRSDFYYKLKEVKKANHFPKKYLTQAHFAESVMTGIAYDEEEPSLMQFVRLQKATYKGKPYNFYCYKLRYDGEDKSYTYLGVAGAFDAKGKKPEPVLYLNGIYYEEEFDAARVEEMLESYLEQSEL